MKGRHRGWIIAGIAVALLALLAVIAAFLADEPLRRYVEGQANERLPEYRTTVGGLSLHPLTLAVELREVVVRQQANPEPPLAMLPLVRADAELWPLFTGKVGADVHLAQPAVSATRAQVDRFLTKTDEEEEAAAWQDLLRDMVPFRLGLSIEQGHATYEGAPLARPLTVEALNITVENLTNRAGDDEPYPARLLIGVNVLDRTEVTLEGQADPLAKPHPAVQADVKLSGLNVAEALRIIGKADLPVREGVVETAGHVVYTPSDKSLTIDHLTVKDPRVEYVQQPSDKPSAEAKEAASTALTWQEQAIGLFPILIHRISIQQGEVVYRPGPRADEIRIHDLDVTAANIRNETSSPGHYPSDLRVRARLGDEARMELDGRADFFARPLPGVAAQVKVDDLHLATLLPVAQQFNVQTRHGVLDLNGRMEYSGQKAKVAIDRFLLEGAKVDYVHAAETKGREQTRAKKGAEQTKRAQQDPSVEVKVGHGKILNSEMGFVNTAVSPDYRVFMADMNAEVDSFSTRPEEGAGVVKVTGKFMGSGPTVVTGTFRPEKPSPDFDLEVKIIKTPVKSMNNLLRAYGSLDTTGGMFAFFSELSVRDNRIDGYVKPLLKDVDVYDPKQDKDKAVTQRLYQAVVGGVLGLLENRPRDEVATQTDISGEVENPQADTWQVVGNLVQNAFFKAILPGFASGRVG